MSQRLHLHLQRAIWKVTNFKLNLYFAGNGAKQLAHELSHCPRVT